MDFKKMLMEKKSKPMDPMAKKAKMGVLESLKGEMSKMMGDDVKGLKKVTIAAPTNEGLEEGLEKAQDLLPAEVEEDDMSDMEPDHVELNEPTTVDEIDAKIAELMQKKQDLKKA